MRSNRYLRSIRRLFWEQKDEIQAIERLLGEYRYSNATLKSIAKDLGVSDVVEEELPFDGGIFDENGAKVIKLNLLNPPIRQRFTLAHEIGHLIFMNRLDVDTECMTDTELEAACNRLAVELLMPRCETAEFVKTLGEPSPENLRIVAQTFRVSLEVAARRLKDLALWNQSIGFWEHRGKPQQLWFVGKKLWSYPPDFAAFDLARSSPVSISTFETLLAAGDSFSISLRMLNLGRNFFLGVIQTY